jgi:membrane protein implicated in regulation of membrane protease activity
MNVFRQINVNRSAVRVAALLAAALLLTAPPARAEFGDPVTVSGKGQDAYDYRVALDPDGDAFIVWTRDGRIQGRARSSTGAFGKVRDLSEPGGNAPEMAMDTAGNVLIVWVRSDGTNLRVEARVRPAVGVLGPVETLSKAGQDAGIPQVAVDADGNALVVWRRYDGSYWRIQGRTRSAAGVLGPVETFSKAGQDADIPRVAMDAGGNALVVWRRYDGSHWRVQGRSRSAAGVVGPVVNLSQALQNAEHPQVAMDGDGDALIVWRNETTEQIEARGRSAAGVLGQRQALSKTGGSAERPRIAMLSDGNALVVWYRYDGSYWRVQGRTRSAAGSYGQVKNFSPAGQGGLHPRVALDGSGNAVISWRGYPGGNVIMQARTRTVAGVLGPVQDISEPGNYTVGAIPEVAMSANGDALAVWTRLDGAGYDRVQASAGP